MSSHTYHHIGILYQWIKEVCGLYKRETTMPQRNNTGVQSNAYGEEGPHIATPLREFLLQAISCRPGLHMLQNMLVRVPRWQTGLHHQVGKLHLKMSLLIFCFRVFKALHNYFSSVTITTEINSLNLIQFSEHTGMAR